MKMKETSAEYRSMEVIDLVGENGGVDKKQGQIPNANETVSDTEGRRSVMVFTGVLLSRLTCFARFHPLSINAFGTLTQIYILSIQDFAFKWLRPIPERYHSLAPIRREVIVSVHVTTIG